MAQDGFRVGDATIKIGGYIDLDINYNVFNEGQVDGNSAGGRTTRGFLLPALTPVNLTDAESVSSTTLDFYAESSRLFVSASRDIRGRPAVGYFEIDFILSGQGNQRVSNSFAPRLRRAYVDWFGFRVGQEWTTFMNLSTILETLTFYAGSDGAVFVRQAMVRYTFGNMPFGKLHIAIENNVTTVSGQLAAHPVDESVFPDLILRYDFELGARGNLSTGFILRHVRDQTGTDEANNVGWGFSLAGKLNYTERGDIRFSLTGGEGLGRYVGLNTVRAAYSAQSGNEAGRFVPIGSVGGHLGIRQFIGPGSWRVSAGVSGLVATVPDDLALVGTNVSSYSAFGALLTDIGPKFTVGIQAEGGGLTKKVLPGVEPPAGTSGEFFRFTWSAKFSF